MCEVNGEVRRESPDNTGDMNEKSDEQLVALSHDGNSLADEILYARYKNTVRIKARPYFLMGADREDLIQEGMIGLYKSIRDYDGAQGSVFRSFAEMCIVRQIITAVKKATRLKHTPLNSYVSIYNTSDDEEDERQLIETITVAKAESPEDAYITKESMSAIVNNLTSMLTPLEKKALDRFLDGLSYKDIADQLGCGTKRVDNALQRVKRKLSVLIDVDDK